MTFRDIRDSGATSGAALIGSLALDVVSIAVFCAAGRRSHAEGVSVAGVAHTAWPFLVGAAVGWVVSRGWRRPSALLPTGVAVWTATVAVGMTIRGLTGAGVAASFIAVATTVTGVLLLGWRALARRARRQRVTPSR